MKLIKTKPKKETKRKGRRARGTGSIFFKEKKNKWVGRVPIGKAPNGKTRYREHWGDTQTEVIEAMKNAKPPGPETTISTWAVLWLDSLTVRQSTKDDYAHTVTKYITPILGHHRVEMVSASHIEYASKKWSETLGANTLRKSIAHLRIMLGAAHRAGLLTQNPATLARKPKAKKVDIDPFAADQLALIIEEATKHPVTLIVALLAGIGCRVGEACALTVPDFDPKKGTVSISQTYSRHYGLGPPKSSHSTRTVRVPSSVLPAIRKAIGDRTKGPLFLVGAEKHRGDDLARGAWATVLKTLGLTQRNLHQARHSVATALISANVPLGDVAVFLGDTVATIVKTYLHPAGTDPTDTLERLLGGRKVGKQSRKSSKSL